MNKRMQDNATLGTWTLLTGRLAVLSLEVQRLRAALTSRQQAALAIFAVFLAIQVAVPLVQLAGDRPQRFGWQMFSGSRERPDFEIISADGSTQAIDIGDHVGYLRLEMEYVDKLADHLCELDSATVAVRLVRDNPAEDEVRACRR